MSRLDEDININVTLCCSKELHNIMDELKSLFNLGEKIMSAISDFAAKQNAFNDQMDASLAGVSGDVQALKDEIVKLQNSPGPISAEDQASLDALQLRTQTLSDKLAALDALTPPPPPAG